MIIDQLYLTTEGIFGMPLGVSATYVILFIIFGTFLEKSGTGQLFMDFASAITGWTRGGPGKISCISSALFGTISGSAVANVMVDGWLTIPLDEADRIQAAVRLRRGSYGLHRRPNHAPGHGGRSFCHGGIHRDSLHHHLSLRHDPGPLVLPRPIYLHSFRSRKDGTQRDSQRRASPAEGRPDPHGDTCLSPSESSST